MRFSFHICQLNMSRGNKKQKMQMNLEEFRFYNEALASTEKAVCAAIITLKGDYAVGRTVIQRVFYLTACGIQACTVLI